MTSIQTDIQLTPEARIQALVEEVLEDEDLFVVDILLRGRQGSQVVEIFLDGDEGIDVDRLAKVSRALGLLLELEDVIKGAYKLIVSSPGVERPLRNWRQYPSRIGRRLKVRLHAESPDLKPRAVVGTLLAVGPSSITLGINRKKTLELQKDTIAEATVQLPW